MLEHLIASISEGLAVVDNDLRYLYCNDAALAMLGLQREEVLGRTAQEVLPADVLAQILPHVRRAMTTQQPVTYDAYVEAGQRWFENRFYPSAGGATLLFVDVTAQRTANQALRRREEMQALLVGLLEQTRRLRDPEEVMWAYVQGLGQHLGVCRCMFGEVDPTQQTVLVGRDYVQGVISVCGRHRLEDFGGPLATALRAGETFVLRDVTTDDRTGDAASRAAFAAIGATAIMVVPLVKDDRLVALLSVHQSEPRDWTDDEVALLERVAEQTWLTVANARAEAALRESRDVLALAMRGGRMGAWSRNVETDEVWWSPELEEIFGVPPGAFRGSDAAFFGFVHPDDREPVQQAIARSIESRADYRVEFRFAHADGSWRWMDGRGRAVYDDSGTPTWLYGIGIDITERKQGEAALEAALARADADAERLHLALAAARLGDWHWDAVTDVVHFSPRGSEIFGIAPDRRITWTEICDQLLNPDDAVRARAAVRGAIESRGDYAIEYRLARDTRWISARGRAQFDAAGTLVGMIGVVQDVSHDRFLVHVDAAMRSLVDPDEIVATATRMVGQFLGVDRCAYANVEDEGETFVISSNYTRGAASILGRHRVRDFGEAFQRSLHAGLPYVVEDSTLDPHLGVAERDGYASTAIRGALCAPVMKAGRLQAVLGVHTTRPRAWTTNEIALVQQVASRCWEALQRAHVEQDRTALLARERSARQHAEMQNRRLAQLSDAAESASRAKDEFMAMLGHELRNPLAPILTALQLMKLRGDAGSERERVVIERQVNHLTRLVDDLLDVSRIARGKVELKVAPVETADVVARAIEMASPLLEQRTHTLHVDVPRAGLPMLVDAERLSQVLANLLTNAAKYTPPGGRITIEAHRDEEQVALYVSDTGIGLPPDLIPNVFDLFVQGRQALDRADGGLGLGLTIVRSLVERHGGTVGAHSDGPGHGSTFTIRVPAAAIADLRDIGDAMPVHGAAVAASSGLSRVLIVDDNEDAAEMLAHVLAAHGHETRVAHDGIEALRACEVFQPQAAFLDLGLPVMDGYELASRLRELPGLETLRLIAVTGYGQDSDRRRTTAAGFHHHLVKPVDISVLEALLA